MLTDAEREVLTLCDCGHDIGGEHNSHGCYGGGRACGCRDTDDQPGVNYAAVERILTDRVLDAARTAFTDGVEWAGGADDRLAAVAAATDDAARMLGHRHPVVVALRAALGGDRG